MCNHSLLTFSVAVTFVLVAPSAWSQDGQQVLQHIIASADKSTLDQRKTHPFHLHASVSPSFERDQDSGRRGEIDIWWTAPGVYRRELRAQGFHMIEIVSGNKIWQRVEGDYLPSWLDGLSNSMLQPLPASSSARRGVVPDKGKAMMGSMYLNWEKPVPMDMQRSKENVAITQATDLVFYDGGLGWGALFKDYRDFHGRMVPRTVSEGSPEATAKIDILEDLAKTPSDFFDTEQGNASATIRFVAIAQTNLAQDVDGGAPALTWPSLPNTREDGVIWTDLVVDREGRIREPFKTISDNPALNDFTHDYLSKLRFMPVLRDGQPVQSIRHLVLHFRLGQDARLNQLLPTDGPA